jgi:hypothetical protein
MTQAWHAHMNNKTKQQQQKQPIAEMLKYLILCLVEYSHMQVIVIKCFIKIMTFKFKTNVLSQSEDRLLGF